MTTPWEDAGITYKAYLGRIKSVLRSGTVRYAPKWKALQKRTKPYYGTLHPRLTKVTQCELCEDWFKGAHIEADHKVEIGHPQSHEDWPGIIERMYCGIDGFQAVCKWCHDIKSGKKAIRKSLKGLTRQEAIVQDHAFISPDRIAAANKRKKK